MITITTIFRKKNFHGCSNVFVLSAIFFLTVFPRVALAKTGFGYRNVIKKAAQLAKRPYQNPPSIPRALAGLNYNQWQNIRFKPDKALWHGEKLPFEVEFFHPGFLYNRTVVINVVRSGNTHQVRFSKDMFTYGVPGLRPKVPRDLGFAGFRIHYPINTKNYKDEFVVFLGASYFRAVGAGETYGLSARGLAIDTAMAQGEEFPWFREFWLVRPSPGARQIKLYALMDSVSASAAYRFVIRPGKETVMTVNCTLFPRKKIEKLGMAPLTSMFFYGENTNVRPDDDFRPQVHDSDGLLVETGTGEWIWRPLINPKKLLVTSFQTTDLKGFGLFQQDRDFDDYQDLESHYEKRPSAWVTPLNGWGKGRVELVEIPEATEYDDNIVAYWVPEHDLKSFSYRLEWGTLDASLPPAGRVVGTRTAGSWRTDKLYLIDFNGAMLRRLPAGTPLRGVVTVTGARLVGQQLEKNRATGGWRLVIHVKRNEGPLKQMILKVSQNERPVELRAFLRLGKSALTDTWSYVDP